MNYAENLLENRAFIGLGSNMGDREYFLRKAVEEIQSLPGVRLVSKSSIYLTEPQGMQASVFFVNQVIEVACASDIKPEWLMQQLLNIENTLGRERDRDVRYTSRTMDLDLLLFNDVVLESEFLILPHPRMHKRAFAMVPLLEIAPDIKFGGVAGQEVLEKLSYTVMDDIIMQQSDSDLN